MSWTGSRSAARPAGEQPSANLADLLERILDKGIVIVGDIRVNLLDIELLTIKLRLLVASVDRAKEMGIDWWEHDPSLSSRAARGEAEAGEGGSHQALEEENRRLRERLAAIEARAGDDGASETRIAGGTSETSVTTEADRISGAGGAAGDGAGKTSARGTRKRDHSD